MSLTITAVVYANLERDLLGAPGTLGQDLAGTPVLTRTLRRLARVEGLDAIVLGSPERHASAAASLAGDVPVRRVHYERADNAAWRSMRAARAFARYGWRGGIGGATVFDEVFDTPLIAAAIEATQADAVLLVPAGAALLDVAWVSELVRRHRRQAPELRLATDSAPPGLSAGLFARRAVLDLARNGLYPGRLFAYDPHAPALDPITYEYHRPLPEAVVATQRRFLADCPRGLWLCREVLARGGEDVVGEQVCRIARDLPPDPWPRELTVELTAERPLEDDLRPHADRGRLPLEALRAALAGLEEAGDVNVMLAGAGDALLHPDWPAAVAAARACGAVGLATYATALDEHAISRLLAPDTAPDILEVSVDAVSEDVYRAFKRGGSAERAWETIDTLVRRRDSGGCGLPMIVPAMLKTRETLDEQDAFFQRCLERTGWGVIGEPTAAAGQWPDRAVVHMAPPVRFPCRRLDARLTVLADGRVTACEEDLHAAHPLGTGAVLDAWRGGALADLRRCHAERRWAQHSLCGACQEFHRP